MKIIVTGSSGTVGTGLCERLVNDHQIIPVDVRPNQWNSKINDETLLVDLRNSDQLDSVPGDADLVVHCGANARVHDLVLNPDHAFDNILTTYNVLEFVRKNNIPRIMFTSSREVYGSAPSLEPVGETGVDVTRCESPYTASKMAGEALVYSYLSAYGIRYVVFRLSNVYGRYDDSSRVIPIWVRNAFAGEPLTVFGPEKYLDFTYLDDAVAGISTAIERFDSIDGTVINLAFGEAASLLDVARMVLEDTGSNSEIVIKETRVGELSMYRSNISRAQELLDFDPKINVREGVSKSVEWYREWLGVDSP